MDHSDSGAGDLVPASTAPSKNSEQPESSDDAIARLLAKPFAEWNIEDIKAIHRRWVAEAGENENRLEASARELALWHLVFEGRDSDHPLPASLDLDCRGLGLTDCSPTIPHLVRYWTSISLDIRDNQLEMLPHWVGDLPNDAVMVEGNPFNRIYLNIMNCKQYFDGPLADAPLAALNPIVETLQGRLPPRKWLR